MRSIVLIFIVFLFGTSCQQAESVEPAMVANGTYTGYFIRSSPNAKYATAKVTLQLNNGQFSGTSDNLNYPAICRGTYKISGQTVGFSNDCGFTANFDWTYILKGNFDLQIDRNKIILSRDYGQQTYDRYELERQAE